MSLPKYYEFYGLFLSALKDRNVHSIKELQTTIASSSHLSADALLEMLPSGKQTVFKNRIGWATTYLKKAGMIDSPKKGFFVITDAGFSLLNSGKGITDEHLAQLSPAFSESSITFLITSWSAVLPLSLFRKFPHCSNVVINTFEP